MEDLSGNNLTGTSSGSYSWGSGKYGSVWAGDGGTSEIKVVSPQSAGGILNPSAITVLAWVKTNNATQDQDIVSSWLKDVGASQSYMLWIDEPKWEWIIRDAGGTAKVCNSSANVTTALTQVVGTYDGVSTLRLYVNGVQVDSDATATGRLQAIAASDNFYIGDRAGADNNQYNGAIDHVIAWNRDLAASERAQLLSEPFCGFRWTNIVQLASYIAAAGGIPIFRRRRAG